MHPEENAAPKDMRSLLLGTLAAQARREGGDNVQELLLSHLGITEDDTDPAMNLIARYLAHSQMEQLESGTSLSPDDEQEEYSGYPSEIDEARVEERARSLQRMRQTMEQMYSELEALRERNDTLAVTLGACYLCWGEDLECPVCGGTGHPGSSMPDKSLLVQFVVPAVQRLRNQGGQDQRAPGKTDPQA